MNLFLVLLGSVLLATSTASGQSIGVYADPLGTNCNLTIPYPGGAVIAYVVGTIDGSAADGVMAAAFRVSGLPSGWTSTIVAYDHDATVAMGDVFREGVAISYPQCTTTPTRRVLLTLSIVPSSAVENVWLDVMPHAVFGGYCGFESPGCIPACPNYCGCDSMSPECYCAQGIPAVINGPSCTVATTKDFWGRVKRLYRN